MSHPQPQDLASLLTPAIDVCLQRGFTREQIAAAILHPDRVSAPPPVSIGPSGLGGDFQTDHAGTPVQLDRRNVTGWTFKRPERRTLGTNLDVTG